MTELTIDRCRSCQAEIVWTVNENGNNQPFDAKPIGKVWFLHHRVGQPPLALSRNHYMPHHATCPQADRWRGQRVHE